MKLADGDGFSLKIDREVVYQSMRDIFNQKQWSAETQKLFFAEVYSHLDGGVEKGFGNTLGELDYDSSDFELLTQLKYNAASLAAFKNHSLATEMLHSVFDGAGELRDWSEFKEAALKLDNTYNTTWLRTEYDTAVGQANMAARWQDFKADAHLYPNLKYIQIQRDTKREDHSKWHGLILPINHKFWDTHLPQNDWGCGCDVEQTDEETNSRGIAVDAMPPNRDGFNINAGKHGKVVGNDHPYFKVKSHKKVARMSKGLLRNHTRNKVKELIPAVDLKFDAKGLDAPFSFGTRGVSESFMQVKRSNKWYQSVNLIARVPDMLDQLEFVFEAAPVGKKAGVLGMYRADITINGTVYTVGIRKTKAGNKFYYIKPKI